MVQPPGIGMPPIAAIEAPHATVTATLTANSAAEMPMKPRWDSRSAALVLIVAAPPEARLVASLGGAIEPWIHAPDPVQSARVGRVGVMDHAVLEHERAHPRTVARVGRDVGPAGRGGLPHRCRVIRLWCVH